MSSALCIDALTADTLSALLLLAVLAFGRMTVPGVVTSLVILAILALNAVAIVIAMTRNRKKTSVNAVADAFT
jgi:hypothetical protein